MLSVNSADLPLGAIVGCSSRHAACKALNAMRRPRGHSFTIDQAMEKLRQNLGQ
jgi:hypothetical protein